MRCPTIVGKRFKLKKPILVLDVVKSDRKLFTIPAGGIIEVTANEIDGDWMVDVLWEGRAGTMFAIDLRLRATEMTA